MFTEQELKDFLELLAAFGLATRLSHRAMSKVLAVPHATLSRWDRIRRGEIEANIVRTAGEPAQDKIQYLNKLSAKTGLYAAINFEPTETRVFILRRELDKRAYY